MQGKYDTRFFGSIAHGSAQSARIVFDELAPLFTKVSASVIDIGCGTGTWCKEFSRRYNTEDVRGVDGEYVDTRQLCFDKARFVPHDLTRTLPADRRFGLSMSLEVAEHLPRDAAPELVRTLVSFADHVLFSAAVPGQGGEFHVNEQPLEYWRNLFRAENYLAVDCLRPALHRNSSIEPWYRYNSVLYVKKERISELPDAMRQHLLDDSSALRDYSSLWWRIRCRTLSYLPAAVVLHLARLKRRLWGGMLLGRLLKLSSRI